MGEWSFRSITRDIAGADDIEALRAELEAVDGKPYVVVQLGLVGAVTIAAEYAVLRRCSISSGTGSRPGSVGQDRPADRCRYRIPDVESMGLTGYAADAARELLAVADSEADDAAPTARDALALLRPDWPPDETASPEAARFPWYRQSVRCASPPGVTVVEGRNEAGNSMIEALDVLLSLRDSSKSSAVRSVMPSGRDVGSEVEAEIRCGEWHFTTSNVSTNSRRRR